MQQFSRQKPQAARTTSSLRLPSICSPCNKCAGGRNCTRISHLRSFRALPAFRMKGVLCHLHQDSCMHELSGQVCSLSMCWWLNALAVQVNAQG